MTLLTRLLQFDLAATLAWALGACVYVETRRR